MAETDASMVGPNSLPAVDVERNADIRRGPSPRSGRGPRGPRASVSELGAGRVERGAAQLDAQALEVADLATLGHDAKDVRRLRVDDAAVVELVALGAVPARGEGLAEL